MTTPSMAGPLAANPDPMHLNVTPFFGPVYVTGAASALGLAQTSPTGTDHSWDFDLSNFQASLQTTSGPFQFFIEPGAYSLPALGVTYKNVTDVAASTKLFSGLPIAWGKIVFNDNFNIQGGRLPTLIGAEYMFTFQNMNIERGLLWSQENLVNQGVQANLTTGPLAWSLSLNDGFYTGQYNYLTGAATWTINSANSVILTGGGPLDRVTATGTPVPAQYNNSTIIEGSYTYSNAPWTITPYLQYTHVDSDAHLGLVDSSTFGGAVLASYAITDKVSLAGRWEYIGSSGAATVGGGGLLGYGPGSSAMSFTLTPTYQNGIFFLRGEASLTDLTSFTKGSGFGSGGSSTQARFLVETGVVF
ncbi:MAG TPA: outer membrane beta-barrel protein [Stellaceae bacterium]|nr:outer membrane beta-barrel protein [Stellaceae bacterium]